MVHQVQPVHLDGIAKLLQVCCPISRITRCTTEVHFPGGQSALSSEKPVVVTSQKPAEALVGVSG